MVRLINPPSLSGLERKLLRLIQFYQTTPKGQLPDSLEVCRLVEYVQTVDFSLRKMKKPLLEKNIANLLVKCTEVSPILVEKETADTEMVPVEGSILEVEAQPIQQEEEHIVPVEDISQNSNVPNNEVALPNVQSQSYNKQNTNAKRRQREYACDERENKRHKSATVDSKYPVPTTRLSDLGGVEVCIEEILELIAMPLTHPEVYLHTGVQPPRGILLHGPPGCGKTLLANAIAGELGVPFLSISAPSVVSGMSGESEKKIREIFQEASEMAPCLMFIDEIDAITPKRETAQREMERRIVAQLLTSMDDLSWEKNNYKPVLIIGATNRPDSLDSALRRAGRFDREIALSVPGEEAREKILQVLSKKLRLSGNFDFKALAKQTAGYVGADLNALTCAAGMIAVRRIFESIRKEPVSIKGNESSEVSTIDEEPFLLHIQILSLKKN
ncbi:Ribosome biogenesis ATPase rix7 [Basidiobolus ranarum]|uniref:Ribosome biogenesis ATPase rix7 n=1 Tax=Basidiobolus ranarum TaxID=34480 RepID=A0ABR2WEV4_9FUNG